MLTEKKKKAILVAVSQYIEDEAKQAKKLKKLSWSDTGRGIMMSNRIRMQRRGKSL